MDSNNNTKNNADKQHHINELATTLSNLTCYGGNKRCDNCDAMSNNLRLCSLCFQYNGIKKYLCLDCNSCSQNDDNNRECSIIGICESCRNKFSK